MVDGTEGEKQRTEKKTEGEQKCRGSTVQYDKHGDTQTYTHKHAHADIRTGTHTHTTRI